MESECHGWQDFIWNDKRPEYVIWYSYNYRTGHIRVGSIVDVPSRDNTLHYRWFTFRLGLCRSICTHSNVTCFVFRNKNHARIYLQYSF